MTQLAPSPMEVLARVEDRAHEYVQASKSANTRRAYRTDWADFTRWCDEHALPGLPATPETIALYLTYLAEIGRKPSTLARRLAAIAQAHQLAGHASPTRDPLVRSVAAGIRRLHGTAPASKTPTLTADIRAMVEALPDSPLGTRDRALLLLGFAGGFRRSELVALDVDDLQDTEEGLVVTIRRSKTDQEGVGRTIGIPYGSNPITCPVRAVRAWLAVLGSNEGPLFRPLTRHGRLADRRLSDRAVARVVQRSAAAAGLDPAKYAGHSLRSGLATSAAMAGVSERVIMAQTGHRSLMTLRRYIQVGSRFRENAAGHVGL